jgi:hypothetical protein
MSYIKTGNPINNASFTVLTQMNTEKIREKTVLFWCNLEGHNSGWLSSAQTLAVTSIHFTSQVSASAMGSYIDGHMVGSYLSQDLLVACNCKYVTRHRHHKQHRCHRRHHYHYHHHHHHQYFLFWKHLLQYITGSVYIKFAWYNLKSFKMLTCKKYSTHNL